MRQSACLVINPVTVDNFAALLNCTPVGRASDSKTIHFSWLRPELIRMLLGPPVGRASDSKTIHFSCWDRSSFVCCLVHRGTSHDLYLLQISNGVVWQSRDLQLSRNTLYLLSPYLCFFVVLK